MWRATSPNRTIRQTVRHCAGLQSLSTRTQIFRVEWRTPANLQRERQGRLVRRRSIGAR